MSTHPPIGREQIINISTGHYCTISFRRLKFGRFR